MPPLQSPSLDSELTHLVDESCSRQAEASGGAVLSSDEPISCLQYVRDVIPLGSGKCTAHGWRRLLCHLLQVGQHRPENGSGRQYDRPLDEVLQLTDVAG